MSLFLCAGLCMDKESSHETMMASDDSSSDNSREGEEHIAGNIDDSTSNVRRVVLLHGHNKWEWSFLVLSVLNSVLLIVISSLVIAKNPDPDIILCFSECPAIVIIATACVAMIFAVYGVWSEHQYEMYSHCFWSAIALGCTWVNINRYSVHKEPLNAYRLWELAISCFSVACWPLCLVCAVKATHAHDWIEFRLIGVSDSLTAMYKKQQLFLALLKSHSIFIVFLVLYSTDMALSSMESSFRFIFYGLSILYSFLIWVLGKMAVEKEHIFLTCGFHFVNTCFAVSNIAAVVVWCYNLSVNRHNICKLCSNGNEEDLLCYVSLALVSAFPAWTIYLMFLLKDVQKSYGFGLHTQSFLDLVCRNSNHLLANERASIVF